MKFTFAPESRPLKGFTLKRAIYRGGFGEVYYGLSDSGKEVALKLLHNTDNDVELRGVQQCLNLSHPNLVTLFDIKKDADGDHWIVMEYVSGETLDSALRRYPNGMPQELIQQWMTGLIAGVQFLHRQGIVHRDLKPANIFMENGIVKIGDVGLSKFMTQNQRSAQTQNVGTVYYMAPEVANGRYGKEVDQYAIGIILYEMITGQVPFDGESTAEILMKHLTQQPDLNLLPAEFRSVVGKALHKDASQRHTSLDQFLSVFKEAAHTAPVHPQAADFKKKKKAQPKVTPLPSAEKHGTPHSLSLPSGTRIATYSAVILACLLISIWNGSPGMGIMMISIATTLFIPTKWWEILLNSDVQDTKFALNVSAKTMLTLWGIVSGLCGLGAVALFGIIISEAASASNERPPLKTFMLGIPFVPLFLWGLWISLKKCRQIIDERSRQQFLEISALRKRAWASYLGSMFVSVLMSVTLTYILYQIAPSIIVGTNAYQYGNTEAPLLLFTSSAMAGSWLLLSAPFIAAIPENRWKFSKSRMLLLGAALGMMVWGMSHYLLMDSTQNQFILPNRSGHADRNVSIFGIPVQQGLISLMLFFGGLFAFRNWSKMQAPGRESQFRAGPIVKTVFVVWIITRVLPVSFFPAAALAAVISCNLQLSSPWMRRKSASGMLNKCYSQPKSRKCAPVSYVDHRR